jgi:hypothetical protein
MLALGGLLLLWFAVTGRADALVAAIMNPPGGGGGSGGSSSGLGTSPGQNPFGTPGNPEPGVTPGTVDTTGIYNGLPGTPGPVLPETQQDTSQPGQGPLASSWYLPV